METEQRAAQGLAVISACCQSLKHQLQGPLFLTHTKDPPHAGFHVYCSCFENREQKDPRAAGVTGQRFCKVERMIFLTFLKTKTAWTSRLLLQVRTGKIGRQCQACSQITVMIFNTIISHDLRLGSPFPVTFSSTAATG